MKTETVQMAPEELEGRSATQPAAATDLRTRRIFLLIDAVALGVVFGVLLSYFRIPLLLDHTTATGGDVAGHIYPPWFLKEHLLPKGLMAGWSPGWYDGFPMFVFYFPLVPLIQALLAFVVPFTVAFKLGTVVGTFFLPVAVYLTFRILRFEFPIPAVGAALTLVFLFMRSFAIFGGNIASSLAGEYAFSLSLGLALVFLALAYQVAAEKRAHPILAAVVLGLAALSHVLPLIAVAATIPFLAFVAIRTHGWRGAVRRLGLVLGLGFALAAFWALPFLVRQGYSAHLHWIQDRHLKLLAPRELWPYVGAAAAGVVLAMLSMDRRFLVLLVPASTSLAMFALLPQQARFFNARFLPFWYLCITLCAAYFIGNVIAFVMRSMAQWRWQPVPRHGLATISGVLAVGLTVGLLGSSIAGARPKSFIDNWIKWNYEGFERKSTWPQLHSLFEAIRALPPGLVWWEPSPDYNSFGTPDVLYAMPYFTGHPTMEGIYYESSISTNYHFVMASELADHPFNPWPGLPYQSFDLDRGIDHLETYGVRYFVAWTARVKAAASASPRLQHIGDAGGFSIYALRSVAQAVVPQYQPVVFGGGDWEKGSMAWFIDPNAGDLPLVRTGPSGWQRVTSPAAARQIRLQHAGEIVATRMTDDEISFDTDAIGEPVIVRTSFFPNWRATGATGPYEVSPSVMMVIPTQRHVVLRYERTLVEWAGLVMTMVGVLVVVFMGLWTLTLALMRRRRSAPSLYGDAA